MKAMILAAGLGKRMRPLTDHAPKPLLKVGDKYLIEFHLEKLAAAGVRDVVINTHWLAQQIPASLGSGEKWGLRIHYSHEPELLETSGGIIQALPMLSDDKESAFLLVNGDVYCEMDLAGFIQSAPELKHGHTAHLALVDNPDHNTGGDFVMGRDGMLSACEKDGKRLTYAGVAIFHRDFFSAMLPGPSLLGPKLKEAIEAGCVSGERIDEYWLDVGTPQRLELLRERVARKERQKADAIQG